MNTMDLRMLQDWLGNYKLYDFSLYVFPLKAQQSIDVLQMLQVLAVLVGSLEDKTIFSGKTTKNKLDF